MWKGIFLTILILILGFVIWQKSQLPWTRMNFVFIDQSLAVVSLEPQKNLTILEMPNNLYLEVPGGFGNYHLGSVYELGQLEGRGGELLKATLQDYLAVPMDGYIKMSNVKCRMSNCFLLTLFRKAKTDLPFWQLIRIWWEAKELRSDKVKTVNLQEANVLTLDSLPDGSQVFKTKFLPLDKLVGKYFSDRSFVKERIKIEVLNATGELGLAKAVARMITNLGGEVISVSNAENTQEKSSMKCHGASIKNSYTVHKLESILKTATQVGEMGGSRADVLILVGED